MLKNIFMAVFIIFFATACDASTKKDADKKIERLTDEQIYEMMKKFAEVFEVMREAYVEEVDERKALEAAMHGMLSSLDPHSSFLAAEDLKEFREKAHGEFGGLGIQITSDKGAIRVISPIDGTPADRAGIKAGDFITHIDGEQVGGMTLSEAVKRMKGKPGTKVKLTIMQSRGAPKTIELTRAIIKVDSVKAEMREDVAYIRISDFGARTVRDLEAAIKRLNKGKTKPTGFVLDMRNNPGGYLSAAINVADMFLDGGEIVSTRGRAKDDIDRTFAKPGDKTKGLPIVVLINHGSASASEIVAGALQDNKRAIVMGTKSFGKGSVQQQMPLGDGTAIHLTIARYYTPSGRSIQSKGIEPDVEVLQSRVEVIESRRDIFSEATLRGALDKDNKDKDEDESDRIRLGEKNDYQLIRALDMVRAMSRMPGKGKHND
ncbi:MAG: S41 family peptidase [Alphaproteobacteria bacterium]|nr:S41 family peptidase [Alphaproteobacteria bacterium]